MTDGYLISAQTARDLAAIKRKVLGSSPPVQGRRGREPQPSIEYEGQMTSDLAAPTNGWTSATQANFQPYTVDPTSSATPPAMIVDPNIAPFAVINRDKTLSVPSGTYCRVRLINGEWRIVWAAC